MCAHDLLSSVGENDFRLVTGNKQTGYKYHWIVSMILLSVFFWPRAERLNYLEMIHDTILHDSNETFYVH